MYVIIKHATRPTNLNFMTSSYHLLMIIKEFQFLDRGIDITREITFPAAPLKLIRFALFVLWNFHIAHLIN